MNLARERSVLAESRLVIEDVPIRVYCEKCQSEQAVVSAQSLVCAVCVTPAGKIVSGRDLDITGRWRLRHDRDDAVGSKFALRFSRRTMSWHVPCGAVSRTKAFLW